MSRRASLARRGEGRSGLPNGNVPVTPAQPRLRTMNGSCSRRVHRERHRPSPGKDPLRVQSSPTGV